MIKDRGNIKWSSLMLTEHREKLKELFEHDDDIKCPEIDEQQLQEMDRILKEATYQQKKVKITFYKNKSLNTCYGKIIQYDSFSNNMVVRSCNKRYVLKISNIVKLTV